MDSESVNKLHFTQAMAELRKRQLNPLRLFVPMPSQQAFLDSKARQRLVVGSNRAGKTIAVCVAIARMLLGHDDRFPKENGRFMLVGIDLQHMGEVVYRKMFRAGAFDIMLDPRTNEWRTVNKYDPFDLANRKLWKPAPPLIPQSMIADMAWENKAQGVPKKITLTNGNETLWLSSKSEPPQGLDVDGVLFDEEIINREWYPEMMARLVDRGGQFIWSATAQAGTEQLIVLYSKADLPESKGMLEKFELFVDDNPYVLEKNKEEWYASMTPDQMQVRRFGKFAIKQRLVYPEYDPLGRHGCKPFAVPEDWCHFMIVDPGVQICAVLFAAIPPTNEEIHIYKEIVINRCSAAMFADAVSREYRGQWFYTFIMDFHGGRVTQAGTGRTIESHYAEELKRVNVSSFATGHGFQWGSDNVPAREEALRKLLWIRPNGTCKLKVHEGQTPELNRQMGLQSYKKIKTEHGSFVIDKRLDVADSHCVDALEYLAATEPIWHKKPKETRWTNSGIYKLFLERQKRMAKWLGPQQKRLGPTLR